MSSIQDRLQQLLDGDIDAAEIADDPTLVSLADRLYGIKIAAVQPVKARDAKDLLATSGAVTEVAPPTNMRIEVIAPEAGINAGVPLPLPDMALDMPPMPVAKKSPLRFVMASGIGLVLANLFGLFSGILGGLCESGTCRGLEQDRLNLMSPHLWGESDGWSYSLLSESMSGVGGVSGGIGIPDIVALVVLAGGWFMLSRRK